MEAIKIINKTREYLDYIEEHILNVNKAWLEIQEKCKDMIFIENKELFDVLDNEIKNHDVSKLSEEELVQYRKTFYPFDGEDVNDDYLLKSGAWDNHVKHNSHHWQNWAITATEKDTEWWMINCVHMIVDWVAMGYKFGDSAQKFYEKNQERIKIPDYTKKFIHEIFNRLK